MNWQMSFSSIFIAFILILCIHAQPEEPRKATEKSEIFAAKKAKKKQKQLKQLKQDTQQVQKLKKEEAEKKTKKIKTQQGLKQESESEQEKKDNKKKVDTQQKQEKQKKAKTDKAQEKAEKAETKGTKNSDTQKEDPEKLVPVVPVLPTKVPLKYIAGDNEFKLSMKLRMPDGFYGKNVRLLNNKNRTDQLFYIRHTLDMTGEYRFGQASRGYDVILAKTTIRDRGIWGDPESISLTTQAEIKDLSSVYGEHKHAIPRHIFWIRELWVQFCVSDLFCLPLCNFHTLTFGAFPFELGRGIALGSAYATDPSDIGFFSESAIDQYAFGAKLSGDFIKNSLSYDIYAAILNNKADTFDNTNLKIRFQQFGHRNDPTRGFGIINYLVAARLRWFPINQPLGKLRIEPYILYNKNPEQRIEFLGDAESRLATAGLAAEFEMGKFEFGFDTAFNFGHQTVHGWDRNFDTHENRDGYIVEVNKRVRQAPPGEKPDPAKSPLALTVKANEVIINTAPRDPKENGEIIKSAHNPNELGTLINDIHRFTKAYTNTYRGRMFVFDGSYRARPDFKISGTVGYASGDANPNRDEDFPGDSEDDRVYEGFIGLQETYSGLRVKSAFLLSGSGRIPRPLSFPSLAVFEPFPTSVGRFTNLYFVGAGFEWKPCWSCQKWELNPNILAYWQDFPLRIFDREKQANKPGFARPYLGLELNLFVEAEILPDLRFFGVSALFLPGTLYKDIKGRPLNKAQQTYLSKAQSDNSEGTVEYVPTLGNDPSYTLNMGFEYRF